MTLEEAQERILELEGKLTEVETERDKLSTDNKTLNEDITRVRALNQKYFEKLSMQVVGSENKDDEEEEQTPTCEEFAKTIKL